ncbi:MAG: DUF2958 domain-containing protein [Sulfurimonas sp.]|nr:DUF2958 domain-containing protein [Sulfurimonas sp.]
MKEIKMSLLSTEQKNRIPNLYAQEEVKDPKVFLHITCLNSFWLITEQDTEKELGFGYAQIIEGCGELGYVSLEEIENLPYPVEIKEVNKTLSEMKKELNL